MSPESLQKISEILEVHRPKLPVDPPVTFLQVVVVLNGGGEIHEAFYAADQEEFAVSYAERPWWKHLESVGRSVFKCTLGHTSHSRQRVHYHPVEFKLDTESSTRGPRNFRFEIQGKGLVVARGITVATALQRALLAERLPIHNYHAWKLV